MVLPDMSRILSACFVNTDCYNGISNLSPPFIRLPDCSMYSYVYLALKRGEKIRQIAYLRNVFLSTTTGQQSKIIEKCQKIAKMARKKVKSAYLRDVFCHQPLVPVRPCCPVLHWRSLRIQIGEVLTELDVGQGCGDLRGLDARLDLRLPHLQKIQIEMDEKFANLQMIRY